MSTPSKFTNYIPIQFNIISLLLIYTYKIRHSRFITNIYLKNSTFQILTNIYL